MLPLGPFHFCNTRWTGTSVSWVHRSVQEFLSLESTDGDMHVRVVTDLEYRIPLAARATMEVSLGVSTLENAVTQLKRCVLPKRTGEPCPPLSDLSDEAVRTLWHLSTRVCNLTQSYLKDVSLSWLARVNETNSLKALASNEAREKIVSARQVYARYYDRSPDIVEEEYRKEVSSIRLELQGRLGELLKAGSFPVCERPPELVSGARDLQEAFSRACGTVPAPLLTQLHDSYDGQLRDIEEKISAEFVRDVGETLRALRSIGR